MEQPLQQALLEYSTAIVSSTGGHEPRTANDNKATTTTTSSNAKDGIHSLTKMVDASLSQIDEVNLCASQIENDTTVLREALLPQLASNTEHLKQMFQTIDALGTFVDQMERTTREAKEQVQQTQKGYDARHPKKMERWIGSLNMFRSKKKDGSSNNAGSVKPPMPALAVLEIPNTESVLQSVCK